MGRVFFAFARETRPIHLPTHSFRKMGAPLREAYAAVKDDSCMIPSGEPALWSQLDMEKHILWPAVWRRRHVSDPHQERIFSDPLTRLGFDLLRELGRGIESGAGLQPRVDHKTLCATTRKRLAQKREG